jgi:hypothetical protein
MCEIKGMSHLGCNVAMLPMVPIIATEQKVLTFGTNFWYLKPHDQSLYYLSHQYRNKSKSQ